MLLSTIFISLQTGTEFCCFYSLALHAAWRARWGGHDAPWRAFYGGYLFHLGSTPQVFFPEGHCWCQNRRISGRGSRAVRLGRMVTGGKGHEVLPRFGPS